MTRMGFQELLGGSACLKYVSSRFRFASQTQIENLAAPEVQAG
jgi:hypothetical protein